MDEDTSREDSRVVASLRQLLTREVLQDVRDVWFQDFTNDHQLIAPPPDRLSRWFKRDDEFDRVCR
jgi:hypothetical protein